jgi:hypothetical protein
MSMEFETLEDLLKKDEEKKKIMSSRAPAQETYTPVNFENSLEGNVAKLKDIQVDGTLQGPKGAPTSNAPQMQKLVHTEYDHIMRPDDPSIKRYLPSAKAASNNVVGEIAPDFAGYESLADRIRKMEKGPHASKLLAMRSPELPLSMIRRMTILRRCFSKSKANVPLHWPKVVKALRPEAETARTTTPVNGLMTTASLVTRDTKTRKGIGLSQKMTTASRAEICR